jgi:hypothetical protein
MLSFNVYLFFSEEWLASKIIFSSGINLNNIIEGFSSTIDTAAWVVLLLLFELETCIIPDEKLVGLTKRALHTIRMLCYIIITYAFYGYLTKVGLLDQFNPTQITDLCTLGADWRIMDTLNVYNQITKETCTALSTVGTTFSSYDNFKIISSAAKLSDVKMLSWVDVINSGSWLLVVIMLEYDVRVQLGQFNSKLWKKYNVFVKATVYFVLLLAAIYWGVTGNFIEFWDAFLWLVAFFLIEMNMFEWQAEVTAAKNKIK